jgi:hypothetical protein
MKAITSVIFFFVCNFSATNSFAHSITTSSHSFTIVPATPAVTGEVFGAINGHRQQNGVSLSWTIITLEQINGFVIERSYDGINYSPVGEVNTVTVGWNRFKDEFVFPGYIHYRVKAIMADGAVVTSPVEIVRIVSKK